MPYPGLLLCDNTIYAAKGIGIWGARGARIPPLSLTLHSIINFSMQMCLENLYSLPTFVQLPPPLYAA